MIFFIFKNYIHLFPKPKRTIFEGIEITSSQMNGGKATTDIMKGKTKYILPPGFNKKIPYKISLNLKK